MLTLLINETKPLAGLFASTTGGIGSVPDISVADEGQAVSVQTFTRTAGVITDSFVAGDVLHIGIGDGVNAPVCYIELSSASPATGTMAINTVGMVALFAATVANRLSLQVGVVRTRGGNTNTIFSAPIVIHRSVIDPDTAVPTPSILGTGVAAALQVAINTALGFVRLDASARLPAVDGSQLTNLPNTGGVTSITGTANEITVTGTTTPTLSLPSALTFTGKTVTGGTFTGGAFNGTVGATTPDTVAGTTGTFSGAVSTSGIAASISTIGNLSQIYTVGEDANISTNGNHSQIYTSGVDAPIYTNGDYSPIYTTNAQSHIYTYDASSYIQTRSTFRLNGGAFVTTLSHAATADRAIAFPDAPGTLALVSGDLGTPSAIVLTNASGTASININGTVGATTPDTVAGTTGTFSGAVTGLTFNAVKLNLGLGNDVRSIALGDFALASTTTGLNNYAFGRSALNLTTTGSENLAFGPAALSSNVTGDKNTAIGGSALSQALGSRNVALGCSAGRYETGSDSLYIDNQDRTNTAGDKANALLYGTFAASAASQQLTINAGTVTLNGSAVTAASLTLSSTTSLLLGTAGSAVGNVGFRNATSGTTTLAPATGALGTGTVTLPLSGTLATLEGANTFTAENINSKSGAASVTAMKFTGVPFAGTGTTSFPLVYINDANATASTGLNTAGTYFGVNGDGTQDLMNLMKDGVSQFKVTSTGSVQVSEIKFGTKIIGMGGIGEMYGTDGSTYWRYGGSVGAAFWGAIALGSTTAVYGANASRITGIVLKDTAVTEWNSDTTLSRSSAGVLQLGTGTTANALGSLLLTNLTASGTLAVTGATTLTGLLTANGGITLGNGQNIAFNTTTGTKIGAATTQKLSFWNATPIVQPTTAVASATVAHTGGGTNIKTDDTFDGYTLAQVVKALRNAGLLA